MKKYDKKGISLIVLVITIIVMIILAAAIILSLNNSGIMDKANQAKTDSDTANLKEYVNVLEAEWELMPADERVGKTKESYVNDKLEGKGYTSAYLADDGTLYTNLQANAKAALKAGIEIGDVVTGYTLDTSDSKKSYPTSGNENTAPSGTETDPTSQTVTRIEYATWRYIGIGEKGEVLIAPDMVSTSAITAQKIKLSGKGGYLNGPQELNDMCAAMYSTSKGTARSMNIDDITRILDYTGDKGTYYDASNNVVTTKAPKKISEIEKELGTTLSNRTTPEGSDIGEYYLDYYYISKTSTDILKSASTDLKTTLTNFVYTSNSYWLASSCVYAYFGYGYARFGVRCVSSGDVNAYDLFFSSDRARYGSYVARPAVSLESNIQLTKVSDGNWSI